MSELIKNFLKNIIGKWRVYTVLFAVIVALYLTMQAKIYAAKIKQKKAEKDYAELQVEQSRLRQELFRCQIVNEDNQESLKQCLDANKQCAELFNEAKQFNDAALNELAKIRQQSTRQINEIKNLQPVTDCDTQSVDAEFAQWMLQDKTSH